MTAEVLIATCRQRGVALVPDGNALVVRPASRVAELLDELRRLKPEVLRLLAADGPATPTKEDIDPAPAGPQLALDPETVRAVLGPRPSPTALETLKTNVLVVLGAVRTEIETGTLNPRPWLIHGYPLADWLSLDDLAVLFARWDRRTRS